MVLLLGFGLEAALTIPCYVSVEATCMLSVFTLYLNLYVLSHFGTVAMYSSSGSAVTFFLWGKVTLWISVKGVSEQKLLP